MKLSVFVAALAWSSVFAETWLWLLGTLQMSGSRIVLYIMFWFLALLSGLWSLERVGIKPRK